jgi:orotidine-5'-phosphate decarboxylase
MPEIIVALDLPNAARTLELLDRLPDARWVKVGSILMTREGPSLVRTLIARGLRVFLDLKWHDIPNTVAEAVAAARDAGVSLATVHALGGEAMMAAAARASDGAIALVGVTVLTSHSAISYGETVGRSVPDLAAEVARLAAAAARAGLQGVVCSPHEVALVRQVLPEGSLVVVPGIRRGGDAAGDQVRVAGARQAALAGATHLVVGRPVLQAANPSAALRELQEEAGCVSS